MLVSMAQLLLYGEGTKAEQHNNRQRTRQMKLTQEQLDRANYLTRLINAYDQLIDDANSIQEAETLEAKQTALRTDRTELIKIAR